MSRKKTHEEFVKEVYELVGDEYKVIGKYQNNKTKIKMRHNTPKCNYYEYEVSPIKFLKGNRCPRCAKNRKKDTKQFKEEVFNLVGDEYVVLGEYSTVKELITMKHMPCDTIFEMTPDVFLRGGRCPICTKGKRMTHEQFVKKIEQINKKEFNNLNEYQVIGIYKDSRTKVKMRHNNKKCGNYEFEVTPDSFINHGSRCPKCKTLNIKNKLRKSQEEFEKEVYDLVQEEYTVIGEYYNARTKIRMRHNKEECNYNEFLVTPYHFLKGTRCPVCSESKGEKKIRDFLNLKNIKYETQYEFNNLFGLGGKPLKFDFAIFNQENNLILLIEYDGVFHFQKVYDGDGHEIIVTHDKRKNEYCKQNNIPLLRIPYWEFDNIETILSKHLSTILLQPKGA